LDAALVDRVRQAMRAAGAARSAQLQDICQASQASVSRALAPLLAAGEVFKVGRARSQAYVMPRGIEGASATAIVPIMKVDERGDVSPFASLIPVTEGRFWVDEDDGPSALHGGLPWFLADMRPQGFMGATFAHAHPGLRLAANPDHWSADDVLKGLCLAGDDLPGNLIVGAESFERYLKLGPPPRTADRDYPALADAAMQGGLRGSSAGGEQPKFCTVRQRDGAHVIVKFSPAGESPVAQRWRDLLVAEHVALQTLAAAGLAAAASQVMAASGRVFLEVRRFDRTEEGRIGMVSLLAYDGEYIGQVDNWAATATRMAARSLLSDADADRLRFLEAFGRLIGNTDRHYGNISLLIERGDWIMAPAYDTLPMIYAPVNGELVERDFDPGALAPTAETLRSWKQAGELARTYWHAIAQDERISSGFRTLAARHADQLARGPRVARAAAVEPPFQRPV
jgi:hypothetical protein